MLKFAGTDWAMISMWIDLCRHWMEQLRPNRSSATAWSQWTQVWLTGVYSIKLGDTVADRNSQDFRLDSLIVRIVVGSLKPFIDWWLQLVSNFYLDRTNPLVEFQSRQIVFVFHSHDCYHLGHVWLFVLCWTWWNRAQHSTRESGLSRGCCGHQQKCRDKRVSGQHSQFR